MNAHRHFDVFNGDADGLCALQQLRLAAPRTAILVTGIKRDIHLLERVEARVGDSATVLDVSLESNRAALLRLLEGGVLIEYFDHHFAGHIPEHAGLHAVIDTGPEVCTSLLVDRHLGGRFRLWAIVAAFGDNLGREAQRMARELGLADAAVAALRDLGENLNYNAYGESEDDLFIRPAALFARMQRHADPFDFVRNEPIARKIGEGRRRDMVLARRLRPEWELPAGLVYFLPDAPWSRRVRGVFGNELASAAPGLAHALLSPDAAGGYAVSVRAPLDDPRGADRLCREFPTGNGRASAAGINHLPPDRIAKFIDAFGRSFGPEAS